MPIQSFESASASIQAITSTLKISEIELAALLGVTTTGLSGWKQNVPGGFTSRPKRLERLNAVLRFIQMNFPQIEERELKSVLENGRFVMDPDDQEDGTAALISFIVGDPTAAPWVGSVREAVQDYLASRPQGCMAKIHLKTSDET